MNREGELKLCLVNKSIGVDLFSYPFKSCDCHVKLNIFQASIGEGVKFAIPLSREREGEKVGAFVSLEGYT